MRKSKFGKENKKVIVAALLIWIFFPTFFLSFGFFWWICIPVPMFASVLLFAMAKLEKNEDKKRKEYEEAITYMEQLLCSYKRWQHLGSAWKDCESLFLPGGKMRTLLEKAGCVLNGNGNSEDSVVWNACCVLHREYDSRRMVLMHEFLCRMEEVGGEFRGALDILLQELQMWKRRNVLFRNKRKWLGKECRYAVFFAFLICVFSEIIMPSDIRQLLCHSYLYQAASIGIFMLLLLIFFLIEKRLTDDWLDEMPSEQRIAEWERQYNRLLRGSNSAKDYCAWEAAEEFPYWLLTVTLYLQYETVYPALQDSVRKSHSIFRKEVEMLLDRIYENPTSPEPYRDFFTLLELEEIQSGMRILYSAGNSGYDDVTGQIQFLIEQNSIVMDRTEQKKFETKMAGMNLWKQVPMIVAAVKVILDMAVVLMMAVQQYTVW